MRLDKNGIEIKKGDTVLCEKLEFVIEEFKSMKDDSCLACGDYGCISIDLLERVETEKKNEKYNRI